mmetsp:Transcript_42718/g.66587  ORF Transcript_42718/g.66587 Transcript_42718/m.66587 type:complete len:234 (-) Transcript_42718:40-741(-)
MPPAGAPGSRRRRSDGTQQQRATSDRAETQTDQAEVEDPSNVSAQILGERRAQVNESLRSVCRGRTDREVSDENDRLRHELQLARRELQDTQVDEYLQSEVDLWHSEVSKLRGALEQERSRREASIRAAAQDQHALQSLNSKLRAESSELAEVQSRLEVVRQKQAQCSEMLEEVERENAQQEAELRRRDSMGSQALPSVGVGRLFVEALPTLDAAAVEFARKALDEQLKLRGV